MTSSPQKLEATVTEFSGSFCCDVTLLLSGELTKLASLECSSEQFVCAWDVIFRVKCVLSVLCVVVSVPSRICYRGTADGGIYYGSQPLPKVSEPLHVC